MPRFDVYRNPNRRAKYTLYLDVQSDLVNTVTRWCIPLHAAEPGQPVMQRAQSSLKVGDELYVLDTPNLLAVPATLLRQPLRRLTEGEQAVVEACIEFMLRGY
ncbi:CcdB family protein [Ottowia sp.]|uniref:CcdB family protein n=1 Tax=Ottowia sp. TaxID=1898956 RepID=UPI002BF77037|nr:CcdB family protein [Ottowia sp.]HOB66680.1 CcdB family protein [Ottowia sp.]HPZ57567.1 CcdB family protein [Ottowia sp.]HQD47069.1 CcdB family protein [Ottowia sp.]